MQQLTILMTCTDRKSVVPSPHLTARSLPGGDVEERCGEWVRRLSTARTTQVPLRDLYKGETWQQFLGLTADASAHWSPRPFVASAGLGLQDLLNRKPSYAATFSAAHADSACSPAESEDWWSGLKTAPEAQDLAKLRGSVMAVLSSAYARAMHEDLCTLARRSDVDLLIVGGWKEVPGATRIPADRALRSALGGTVGSLLPRMARQWMALSGGEELASAEAIDRWSDWAANSRNVEKYDRKPMSDTEIAAFLQELRREQPRLSATTALRILRDAGFACEQKRFGRLFRLTEEAA